MALDEEVLGVERLYDKGGFLDAADTAQSTGGLGRRDFMTVRHERRDGEAQPSFSFIDGGASLSDAGALPLVLLRVTGWQGISLFQQWARSSALRWAVGRG